MGYALYKYFTNLAKLIEHSHTYDATVSKLSCFNLELHARELILVLATTIPRTYYYMRRSGVEKVLSRLFTTLKLWIIIGSNNEKEISLLLI
jgi:hypothetical protein